MQGGVAGVEQVVRRLPGRRPYTLLHCHTTATQYNTTDRRPYALLHSSHCSTVEHTALAHFHTMQRTRQASMHAALQQVYAALIHPHYQRSDTAFLLPLWYRFTIRMA